MAKHLTTAWTLELSNGDSVHFDPLFDFFTYGSNSVRSVAVYYYDAERPGVSFQQANLMVSRNASRADVQAAYRARACA